MADVLARRARDDRRRGNRRHGQTTLGRTRPRLDRRIRGANRHAVPKQQQLRRPPARTPPDVAAANEFVNTHNKRRRGRHYRACGMSTRKAPSTRYRPGRYHGEHREGPAESTAQHLRCGRPIPSRQQSFMIAGIPQNGTSSEQSGSEPRLARALGVQELKRPLRRQAGRAGDPVSVHAGMPEMPPHRRALGARRDKNTAKCKIDNVDLSPFRLIGACRNRHERVPDLSMAAQRPAGQDHR